MTSYEDRRAAALAIAAATPGYERVPSPERVSSREKGEELPYHKLIFHSGERRVMPRQERRSRDRFEAKEPVLSTRLSRALASKESGDGLLIQRGSYIPTPAGQRLPAASRRRAYVGDVKSLAAGVLAMGTLAGLR